MVVQELVEKVHNNPRLVIMRDRGHVEYSGKAFDFMSDDRCRRYDRRGVVHFTVNAAGGGGINITTE